MSPTSMQWKDIIGYEGLYKVSSTGMVKSLDRKIKDSIGRVKNIHSKILTSKLKNGYLCVNLYNENKIKTYYIHRLVATAFCKGKTTQRNYVNHIDMIKTNNHFYNLEWVTSKENIDKYYKQVVMTKETKLLLYKSACKSDCNCRWKTVNAFSRYEVSTCGKVRNKRSKRLRSPYLSDGYLRLNLTSDLNKSINVRIHRLVAESFLKKSVNKPLVNHLNGDRTDNRLENLSWCTNSENMIHANRVLGKNRKE